MTLRRAATLPIGRVWQCAVGQEELGMYRRVFVLAIVCAGVLGVIWYLTALPFDHELTQSAPASGQTALTATRHLVTFSAASYASTETGGVTVALEVAPGPYFLGETIPVTVSVINGSNEAIALENDNNQGLNVTMSGGSAPYARVPFISMEDFGVYAPAAVPLEAGQSLSQSNDVVLDRSGRVRLTAAVGLPDASVLLKQPSMGSAGSGKPYGAGNFAGHLPGLTIAVAPATPCRRMLKLSVTGQALHVSSVAGDVRQVFYAYSIACSSRRTGQLLSTAYSTSLGRLGLHISAPIAEPRCFPDTYLTLWQVVVTAPGYGVSSATYCTTDTKNTLSDRNCDALHAQHVAL
jgi:hypothetical protein